MKVLFIGGTGVISSACLKPVLDKGHELCIFNRGISDYEVPKEVKHIKGDIYDKNGAFKILKGLKFNTVVNWIAFTRENVLQDIELFGGNISQYIFISSASAYQKPPLNYMITESTPMHNPFWEYSRNKIACENALLDAYRKSGFPVTIVRPSYTYNERCIPNIWGNDYTTIDRMLKNEKIIIHGDGQSLWVMTHNRDFAKGFAGLVGNLKAIGEAYHITSDEVLTWDQIYKIIAAEAGAGKINTVHIPSDFMNEINPEFGASLLGDKACSFVFDNAKIKKLVPEFKAQISFAEGIRASLAWYDRHPEKKTRDKNTDDLIEKILSAWNK